MIPFRTPGIILVVLMLTSTACARAQSTECAPGTPVEFDRCLERQAKALLAEGFPSFSFGVVRGDTLVYARSFGIADRETGARATPRTLYQIGSVTKMFTGLLFARMVETVVVRIGDPIARYLWDLPHATETCFPRASVARQQRLPTLPVLRARSIGCMCREAFRHFRTT